MPAKASVGTKVPKTPKTPTTRSKKSNRKPKENQGVLRKTGMARNHAIEIHGHVIADIKQEESNLKKEREIWQEDLAKLLKKANRKTYNDSGYGLKIERSLSTKETVRVVRTWDDRNPKDKKASSVARRASKDGKG